MLKLFVLDLIDMIIDAMDIIIDDIDSLFNMSKFNIEWFKGYIRKVSIWALNKLI